MADYIKSLLTNGEVVVFETRISWFEYIPWILAIVAVWLIYFFICANGYSYMRGLLIVLPVTAALYCAPALMRRFSEFAVTNRRVIMKTGIIGRKVFEMRLAKIESVDLDQGIAGRIFNFGTVTVHGTGDTARHFHMIDKPVQFRRAIDLECEKQRNS